MQPKYVAETSFHGIYKQLLIVKKLHIPCNFGCASA